MFRWKLNAMLFVAVSLVGTGSVHAQSTATLQGAVTDAQNAVMPGVSITVHNAATNQDRTLVTDATGHYAAAALAPGHYEVKAHIDGFQEQKREIDLGPAQTVELNVKLSVGAVAENVTVSGAAPLIDTATVSVGQVMAEKTVQEIPLNGRHFVDLGPLMPGGSTSPQNAGLSAPLRGQGGFSFMTAGNRETSVNFMVNGINLNDLSNSQVTFQPSINTVSEFKVDNSTFSAEYGRNSGAIVNVSTRSGGNDFHGEAFDFYRDQDFDARNYFNPSPAPQSTFNRKQFGVNLGGPIVKNKTFFFGSYEGLRHLQGVDLNSGTLSDAQRAAVIDPVSKNLLQYIPKANDSSGLRAIGSELAPVTIDQGTGDVRQTIGKSDDLHFYYAFQSDFRHEPNAQGNTVAGFGDDRGGHRQILTVNETHIFSPALVNEVRAGYNKIKHRFQSDNTRRYQRARDQPRPDAAGGAAADHDFGPRIELRRSRWLSEHPRRDDGSGRRHGDLPAWEPGHQVRRRDPSRQAQHRQRGPGHLRVSERGRVSAGIRQRARHHARRPQLQRLRERDWRLRAGLHLGRIEYQAGCRSALRLSAVADRSRRQARDLRSRHIVAGPNRHERLYPGHQERQRLPAAPRRRLDAWGRRQARDPRRRMP